MGEKSFLEKAHFQKKVIYSGKLEIWLEKMEKLGVMWELDKDTVFFYLIPLPIVIFKVVEKAFDRLGQLKPASDRIEIEKIVRPKGPDLEHLVHWRNDVDTLMVADKQKYVECLQQLLNQPKVEVLEVSEFPEAGNPKAPPPTNASSACPTELSKPDEGAK